MRIPDPSITIDGDQVRIVQFIANLLNNAAKFTPSGGTIDVSVKAEKTQVTIQVKDNGIGIDTQTLPHIFDLFSQENSSLDRSEGGLGIGLTLVKNLTELHGGNVTASIDGQGRGSTFSVHLPIAKTDAQSNEVVETLAKTSAGNRRVLIIDDNMDSADAIAMLLQLEGHQVRTAADGPTGIAAAADFRPDVVLCDIGLPGMNGYEVAERMRKMNGWSLTMIAVMGYGRPEDMQRSFKSGFAHHLVKPIDPNKLNKILLGIVPP